MGAVYEVEHQLLKQKYALKILSPDRIPDRVIVERFRQEAKAVSSLDHPNLLRIFEFGISTQGQPFFVTDLFEGVPLSKLIKDSTWQEKLSSAQIIRIMLQAADALAHAHQRSVIHRDIKPSNILVGGEKDDPEVKIIDFGIAKQDVTGEDGRPTLTATGEIIGTPQYMSPEQCQGFKLDERSDIYSLGVLLYEMLAGTPPFESKNSIQILFQHLNDQPPAIQSTDATRRSLEAVALKCLAKDRDYRYQSMDDIAADLKVVASGGNIKIKRGKKKATSSFAQRLRVYASLSAVAIILAVVAALYELWAPSLVLNMDLPFANLIMSKNQAQAIVAMTDANSLRLDAVNQDGTLDMEKLDFAERRLKQASVGDKPWNRLALIRLASIMGMQQKWDGVDKICRQVGVDDSGYALALHNVAVSLDQGHYYVQARPLMEKAYKTFESVVGPNNPATVKDQFNLMTVDYNLGNKALALKEAEAVMPKLVKYFPAAVPMCKAVLEELQSAKSTPSAP